jgi:hypothetical protein
MNPRFRGSSLVPAITLAAVALLGLTGCDPEPSQAASVRLPRLDLCQTLDRTVVETALLGKVTGCRTGGDAEHGYGTQFTATVTLGGGRQATATLTVAYAQRMDLRAGDDRWADASAQGDRVALIGVGDQAAFDAKAAPNPQLVVRKDDRVLSVGLALAGADVPQDQLPDHLLAVADQLLDQLKK